MEFSLFYFADDASADGNRYQLLLDGARFADTHGFSAVWTPERHFHTFGGLYPNPAVTGAALAAVTERVSIRAGSVVAPLHHPVRIAEDWSVVDNLSNGRTGVAFASGWHANDFVLNPDGYATRRESLTDTVDQVRRLWRGESVPYPNGVGEEVDVRIFPAPVQPQLPMWITSGGSPETFRTAGRLGAGVLTHLLGQGIDVLADRIAAYRAELAEHHGEDHRGQVTLMLHTFLGEDRDTVKEIVRGPFTGYLRSSADLFSAIRGGGAAGLSPDEMPTEEEIEWLLNHSFERYFTEGSLLGTVPDNLRMLERLDATGVDEVACLIDFGVDAKLVMDSLVHLDELRVRWTERP
ncbi:natural product biosynthesis luciferase-like monooxygenase domain-containing protein [Streptomyces sp. yr375]|uniref:LLM class flavin-dependent oxidoreductase n=1 Tax=Streptomyces sp. yr375 TaxID=1761906 RepID=UPI0008ABEB98|nr:LLM class flavin-dependent oxidoreductase [Streptomyces sp. yr375]SES47686.1 natural product biosynthesis luciferase-like monooxygenase domain-containing protein [Streptomyces sp. yr375]